MHPHEDLHVTVNNGFICNYPKMETTQTSINQRTNRKIVVYPDNGLLLINKKKLQIHINMNGSQKNYAK